LTKKFGLLASLACLLIGCRSGDATAPAGAVVVALDAEPQSLDPRFGTDVPSSRAADLLHTGLTRPGPGSTRVPALARAWHAPDARTLVFDLRRDFRFASGEPVTAADVKATYDAVLDPGIGSPRRAALAAVAAVDAPDDHTVVMRLRQPFAPLLDATGIGILPAARARGRDEVSDGAGPFRVARAEPDRLVLEPNPGWPDGPVTIGGVVLRVVPDPLVRVLDLRRGGLQLLEDPPEPELLDWLRRDPHLAVERRPGTTFAYLALNLRDPRLRSRRVREAIALALDREALVRAVLGGNARVATGLLAPEHWAYAPLPVRGPDLARARRLLDRAGWPDPDGDGPARRFRIVYKASSIPLRRRLAEAIQAQLADVGIAVDVRTYEWGTLYADLRAGRFEVAAMSWVGVADPDLYFLTLHSSMVPPAGLNRGHYASRVMDRLTAQGRTAADVATRRRIYARVQRRAAHDLPVIPLWWEDRVVVRTTRLVGFEATPSGDLRSLAWARIE
jgi:peptide/nickel transport system substrate-binding protein